MVVGPKKYTTYGAAVDGSAGGCALRRRCDFGFSPNSLRSRLARLPARALLGPRALHMARSLSAPFGGLCSHPLPTVHTSNVYTQPRVYGTMGATRVIREFHVADGRYIDG